MSQGEVDKKQADFLLSEIDEKIKKLKAGKSIKFEKMTVASAL